MALPNKWSHPQITCSGKPLQDKLGGTGLGLLALLSAEKINIEN